MFETVTCRRGGEESRASRSRELGPQANPPPMPARSYHGVECSASVLFVTAPDMSVLLSRNGKEENSHFMLTPRDTYSFTVMRL